MIIFIFNKKCMKNKCKIYKDKNHSNKKNKQDDTIDINVYCKFW